MTSLARSGCRADRTGSILALLLITIGPGANGQQPSDPASAPEEAGTAVRDADQTVLGRGAAFEIDSTDKQTIPVAAGTPILRRPHPGAEVLEVLLAPAELAIEERREPWIRVRYQGLLGWILPADPDAEARVPATAPLTFHPDEERLGRVRKLLGAREQRTALGPYLLYTDLKDASLLRDLGRLAAGLEATYRQRFGLEPALGGSEAVLLFAREEDYRAFESQEPDLRGAETHGYTTQGLAVTFVGDRPLQELHRILIHELTHLLGRSAADSEVAPWLEEGLAEDLAISRIDGAGRVVPGSLAGRVRRRISRPAGSTAFGVIQEFDISGPVGSLNTLLLRWTDPQRPPLAEFVGLAWGDFLEPDLRSLYYSLSAFLVRYLLDGDRSAWREPFLAYLRETAAGEAGGLWERLRVDPSKLERDLHAWLVTQAESHGLPRTSTRPEPSAR